MFRALFGGSGWDGTRGWISRAAGEARSHDGRIARGIAVKGWRRQRAALEAQDRQDVWPTCCPSVGVLQRRDITAEAACHQLDTVDLDALWPSVGPTHVGMSTSASYGCVVCRQSYLMLMASLCPSSGFVDAASFTVSVVVVLGLLEGGYVLSAMGCEGANGRLEEVA